MIQEPIGRNLLQFFGVRTIAPTENRYKAFISYSHKDRAWGDWLHRELETYEIPRELIGKSYSAGPIPQSLRPVFRDICDLAAGHTISQHVARHLAMTDALVVLCSPHAARSPYVNDEVRRFKALGGTSRIFPVILDGAPDDPANPCFPPALMRIVTPDGRITDERVEPPLAADLRANGDGRELGEIKIIAGLLGIDLDQLRRREEIERRARQRRYATIASTMAALAVVSMITAGLTLWLRYRLAESNQQLATSLESEKAAKTTAKERLYRLIDVGEDFSHRTVELAETRGLQPDVAVELLELTERPLKDLATSGVDDPRLNHRLAVISVRYALSNRRLGRWETWQTASLNALRQMRAQVALHPSDPEFLRGLGLALYEVGDTHKELNQNDKAMQYYREARAIRERLAALDPRDPKLRRDLSAVLGQMAEVNRAGSRLDEAFSDESEAVRLRRELVREKPDNADAALDLTVALIGLAQTHRKKGELDQSLALIAEARDIRTAVIATDGSNLKARRLLSWALSTEAEVLQLRSVAADAVAIYKRVIELRERNVDAQETNVVYQRDLAWAYFSLAEVLLRQRDFDGAERAELKAAEQFEKVLEMTRHRSLGGQASPKAYRDLGLTHGKLGAIHLDAQKWQDALASLERAQQELRVAIGSDATRSQWRFELAMVLTDLGLVQNRLGRAGDALASMAESRAHLEQLVKLGWLRGGRMDALKRIEERERMLDARASEPVAAARPAAPAAAR